MIAQIKYRLHALIFLSFITKNDNDNDMICIYFRSIMQISLVLLAVIAVAMANQYDVPYPQQVRYFHNFNEHYYSDILRHSL